MRSIENNIYIIDVGNTSIKFGVFEDGDLKKVERVNNTELLGFLSSNILNRTITCVLSSVASEELTAQFREYFSDFHLIDIHSKFPFVNAYRSPSLGIDRACNAAAVIKINSGKNSVAIDIGTCIKFDFVDENGVYHGGSISPGIHLRYKSLNDYTAKLPLLNSTEKLELVGDTTELSIQSGVINGMQAEINDMIRQYENKFPDLTFFVTGGDAKYFDFERKNNIFANENLTLWGIYYVYQQNVQ